MIIRKATISDINEIHCLVNYYADKKLMLSKTLDQITENIRDFIVAADELNKVCGCASLHIYTPKLAEIKSVAVDRDYFGKGIGRQIIEKCIEEAKTIKLEKVFCLTYQDDFFKKLNFTIINKETLPEKIWADCINCAKFKNCDEIAMILPL